MRVVIAHGHIFKNAGSTFDWTLKRNFERGFLDHREDKAMREGRADYLLALTRDDENLEAISSHHLCRPPTGLPDIQFVPVYFLRHPVERIASVYAFERQQRTDTPGAKAARRMDFADYVAWRMEGEVARTIRDYQTFYLAGMPRGEGRRPLSNGSFRSALQNLAGTNCIGLVDRYDQSMVLFEVVLRQHFPDIDLSYVRQNVGRKHDATLDERVNEVLDQLGSLKARVLENNAFDLCLYRAAGQKLDAAIARANDFEALLADFRARCDALQ